MIVMKFLESVRKVNWVLASCLFLSLAVFAQEEPTPTPTPQKRDRVSKNDKTQNPKVDVVPTETPVEVKPTPEEIKPVSDDNQIVSTTNAVNKTDSTTPAQDEDAEIKEAIVPIYTNYLTKYELGPEDVISIEVFGQCDKGLCKTVSISPTTIIYFPFVPGGIFVGGKTTEQVGKEIAKKLDEYIIDPQVTVNLEKVVSAQFSILGKVGIPGVRTMTRRYSVYEAIVEAGGYGPEADKKRITLLRRTAQGGYTATILKVDEMVAGKVPMEYLIPGDQIVVPEKKWSMSKILDVVGKVSAFRILFGSPF